MRNYKPVKRGPQYKWDNAAMQKAIDEVNGGKLTCYAASKQYALPKTTLLRRCRDKGKASSPAVSQTVLTPEEETTLADWCVAREERLFGVTPEMLCRKAFQIVDAAGRPHRFNQRNGQAGYDWLRGFTARHPTLSIRKPEGLSAQRARSMNEVSVGRYFKLLGETLQECGIKDKPSQIWNCDESGLSSVHKPPRIMATKGKKQVHSKTSGERGFNTTVLACANAAGAFIPPFIIFKGVRLQEGLIRYAPPGSLFGCSPTSFINADLFHLWLQFFIKSIPPARPVLLILDGHASHVTLESITLAKDNDVVLLCLPPHTTHWLQPLDRTVFGPLKTAYNEECTSFMATHPGRVITRYDFSELFGKAYLQKATPSNAINGFRGAGVFPFDQGAIPQAAYYPSRAWALATANTSTISSAGADPMPEADIDVTSDKVTGPRTTPAKPAEMTASSTTAESRETAASSTTDSGETVANAAITAEFAETAASDSTAKPAGTTANATSAISAETGRAAANLEQDVASTSRPTGLLTDILTMPTTYVQTGGSAKKTRQTTRSRVLTADEFMLELRAKQEQQEKEATEKEMKKQTRKRKAEDKKKAQEEKRQKKNEQKASKTKKVAKANKATNIQARKSPDSDISETEDHETFCTTCNMPYFDEEDEPWTACRSCDSWFHDSCTRWRGDMLRFVCTDCLNQHGFESE